MFNTDNRCYQMMQGDLQDFKRNSNGSKFRKEKERKDKKEKKRIKR